MHKDKITNVWHKIYTILQNPTAPKTEKDAEWFFPSLTNYCHRIATRDVNKPTSHVFKLINAKCHKILVEGPQAKRKMSEHGATLQSYNQELVKCLEDLKVRRKEMLEVIVHEEHDKSTLEKSIRELTERLERVNGSLDKHKALCTSYEKTIRDTEKGFKKILESSHMLLNLAQQESTKLNCQPNSPDSSPGDA